MDKRIKHLAVETLHDLRRWYTACHPQKDWYVGKINGAEHLNYYIAYCVDCKECMKTPEYHMKLLHQTQL